MLFFVITYLGSGSGIVYAVYRLVRSRGTVMVARTDATHATARMEAAREASAVAQGQAQEALAQTGQALEIARTIELVHENVQGLTDYLVSRIDGEPPARRAGRHALPGSGERPAIAGGTQEGMLP